MKGEAEVNSIKLFLGKIVILILILCTVASVSAQPKKEEIISFPGFIKSISKDYQFIVINADNILITSSTRIANEKGMSLRVEDLRAGLYVVVEATVNLNGLLAKKIVVKPPPPA